MDTIDRRRYKRYSVYCPIEFRAEGKEPIEASVTLNLCEGGALISTRKPLRVGSNIIVKITLNGELYYVRARVVHFSCEREGALYTAGVEFYDNPINFVRRLYEEVETIMLYQRQCCKESGRTLSLSEASIKWYSSARDGLVRWVRQPRAALNS